MGFITRFLWLIFSSLVYFHSSRIEELSRGPRFKSRSFFGSVPTPLFFTLDLHPRKLTCPLKRDYFNRKYIFQPLIFRRHSLGFSGVQVLKHKHFNPSLPNTSWEGVLGMLPPHKVFGSLGQRFFFAGRNPPKKKLKGHSVGTVFPTTAFKVDWNHPIQRWRWFLLFFCWHPRDDLLQRIVGFLRGRGVQGGGG